MGALKASAAVAAAAATAIAAAAAAAQFSDREYRYEPAVTVLSGVVTKEDRPVPETGGEASEADERESVYLLKLDRTIIVIGDATHDFNSRTEEVGEIQLTRSSPRLGFEAFVTRRAAVTGRLFHAHSAYHRTKVLMMVEKIEAE